MQKKLCYILIIIANINSIKNQIYLYNFTIFDIKRFAKYKYYTKGFFYIMMKFRKLIASLFINLQFEAFYFTNNINNRCNLGLKDLLIANICNVSIYLLIIYKSLRQILLYLYFIL